MPEPATLLVFAAAACALVAVPGPNVVYIATRSDSQGRRSGLATALGIETGTLVHVAAAAVGLSALLASSALAFATVKYAGAAHLAFLGVRALLLALFFLAFLPQFVDPARGPVAPQILVLGATAALTGDSRR